MLTVIGICLVGAGETGNIAWNIFSQLTFGSIVGIVFAIVTILVLTKTNIVTDGLDTIFMIAAVLFCYAASEIAGGNQYLSVYFMGIIIGNSKIKNKNILIPFFDGVTSLAQILIFFLLGLLSFPHRMPQIILPALAIVVILTLVARPLSLIHI